MEGSGVVAGEVRGARGVSCLPEAACAAENSGCRDRALKSSTWQVRLREASGKPGLSCCCWWLALEVCVPCSTALQHSLWCGADDGISNFEAFAMLSKCLAGTAAMLTDPMQTQELHRGLRYSMLLNKLNSDADLA